jgi:ketosteroid isomerase-like protein
MVRNNLLAILFFILVAVSCQQTHELPDSSSGVPSPEVEKEIRGVVMKIWEDAVKGDTTSLNAVHLKSPKFTKFGPRIAVRQDVKSTNKTETEHFSSITDGNFKIEDLKVDIFGDVAITTFYNNYSFVKNNVSVMGKGRVTLVFLNTEEGWKIIHEHSSPFNE